MKANRGILIQPNPYEAGGQMMWVCCVAFPIHNKKNEIVGMLGVDMSLSTLSMILKTAKVYETGYLSLIAHTGLTAVTKNSENEGEVCEDFVNPKTSNLFANATKTLEPFEFKKNENGTSIIKLYQPLTVDGADEVWFLGVNVPEKEVFSIVSTITFFVSVLFVITLIIVILLTYFIIEKVKKTSLAKETDIKKASPKQIVLTIIGAVGGMFFLNLIMSLLPIPEAMLNNLDNGMANVTSSSLILGLITNSFLVPVMEEVVYSDLTDSRDALFMMLMTAGYLKPVKTWKDEDCADWALLQIPNLEVRMAYRKEILGHIVPSQGESLLRDMLRAMTTGDTEEFSECLSCILRDFVSYHDTAQPESFYHGLMLGFSVLLDGKYQVKSNRESGYGRFDLAFFPLRPGTPGVILELKAAGSEEELEERAKEALQQIAEKEYCAELSSQGVKDIWRYGIAFHGKKVYLKSAQD
jgi:hypothetical protein